VAVAQVVEQSTYDAKFKGSYPATACTGRKKSFYGKNKNVDRNDSDEIETFFLTKRKKKTFSLFHFQLNCHRRIKK
jgi:hypothetical protein